MSKWGKLKEYRHPMPFGMDGLKYDEMKRNNVPATVKFTVTTWFDERYFEDLLSLLVLAERQVPRRYIGKSCRQDIHGNLLWDKDEVKIFL